MQKLVLKEFDTFPADLEKGLIRNEYLHRFNETISKNFPDENYNNGRFFKDVLLQDQYKRKHYLPLFISKISPPDSSNIEPDPRTKQLARGIRTMSEVAHYVRCIPFKQHEYHSVWSSPDFILTMRIGSIEEHALLMASMFRAVKYEDQEAIQRAVEAQKKAEEDSEESEKEKGE